MVACTVTLNNADGNDYGTDVDYIDCIESYCICVGVLRKQREDDLRWFFTYCQNKVRTSPLLLTRLKRTADCRWKLLALPTAQSEVVYITALSLVRSLPYAIKLYELVMSCLLVVGSWKQEGMVE